MTKKKSETAGMKIFRDALYQRNRSLYDVDAVKRVHIVGCGGVGSWAAIGFAMAGCRDIHVYDDDLLNLNNLNRLPFELEDVGKPKTEVIKGWVEAHRPDAKVTVHERVASAADLPVRKGDVVVIAVDSATQNNAICSALKGKPVTVLRGAYNGESITVGTAGPQWSQEPGGYNETPSYVVPAAIVGMLLVEKAYRTPDLRIGSKKVSELAG